MINTAPMKAKRELNKLINFRYFFIGSSIFYINKIKQTLYKVNIFRRLTSDKMLDKIIVRDKNLTF